MLSREKMQSGKSDADEFSEHDAKLKERRNFVTYARCDILCNGPNGNGCDTAVQNHIVHEGMPVESLRNPITSRLQSNCFRPVTISTLIFTGRRNDWYFETSDRVCEDEYQSDGNASK
ncbi:unnamed protein product [Albugo candida]|uniref:Uncharacterized protein n=1 Tax=Albugo candida TaxID=65357 RepID=A0A024GKZ0_9STRA|nr:unnamed protein product [Albugo candida]|eukprot:CCI46996.1 unnamed protein product [Albugo candida]